MTGSGTPPFLRPPHNSNPRPSKNKPADNVIRLYRNYDPSTSQGTVQMVSAFRGLNEVVQMPRGGSGVILDWKQSGGSLLVGGDSRIIRVWDVHTETQVLVSVFLCSAMLILTHHQIGPGNQRRQPSHLPNVRQWLVLNFCRVLRRRGGEGLRSEIGRGGRGRAVV